MQYSLRPLTMLNALTRLHILLVARRNAACACALINVNSMTCTDFIFPTHSEAKMIAKRSSIQNDFRFRSRVDERSLKTELSQFRFTFDNFFQMNREWIIGLKLSICFQFPVYETKETCYPILVAVKQFIRRSLLLKINIKLSTHFFSEESERNTQGQRETDR